MTLEEIQEAGESNRVVLARGRRAVIRASHLTFDRASKDLISGHADVIWLEWHSVDREVAPGVIVKCHEQKQGRVDVHELAPE